MQFINSLEDRLTRAARHHVLSARNFQIVCGICGILCSLTFLFSFVASHNIPPMKPYWTAEQTVQHWRTYESGTRVGAGLMLVSGAFYLPLTAAISAQMRRIPNLHYVVSALQLAAGAAGIFTYMMPAMILATIPYRLERPIEITQALTDFFWICCLMPWPTFMAQNFALAYAILVDTRAKPVFPKWVALVNITVPILFVPAIGMHCVKTGPLAWNGGMTFWMAGSIFCTQLGIDSICIIRAVWTEYEEAENPVDPLDTDEASIEKTNCVHESK